MAEELHVTVIDGENSFCKKGGSLYVPGAEEGTVKVANCIKRLSKRLDSLHVTQDLHHRNDISHAGFWRDRQGRKPDTSFFATGQGAPTIIRTSDVKDRVWTPAVPAPELMEYAIFYLSELERMGRFPHIIWPDHCLIGTEGSNIPDVLMAAYDQWCDDNFATLDVLTKGTNWKTEHFGALKAEVPDPADLTTQMNMSFIQTTKAARYHILFGWASSHCKRRTLEQMVENLPPEAIKNIIYITDEGQPIPGFEAETQAHLDAMKTLGVTFDTCAGVLS